MLTSRGWWFLLIVLGLLALALLANPTYSGDVQRHDLALKRANVGLALLALTLGIWFVCQWVLFAVRAQVFLRRLEVRRQVHDERGPVDSLWAGRFFRVEVELALP